MKIDPKVARQRDMAKLRKRMDGDDNFMTSHQIKKIRTRDREIPAWALNDEEIRKILLQSFPSLKTSRATVRRQRERKRRYRQSNRTLAERAGRWARIIHLFYRVQMSNSQVAKEMGESLNAVKMTLKSIRRVARGQRSDNAGPLKLTPSPLPTRE